MIRHATFPADEIFTLMDMGLRKTTVDGHLLKLTSQRLQLFHTVGADCVRCEVQGAFFALESVGAETPHLNLYGVNAKGHPVLMTKDHIKPKARGGKNEMDNYQPMCVICNGKKADKPE